MKSIATTIVLFACAAPAAADTLLHSVTGYTSTANGDIRQFSALVFDDDGRIVATGGDELIAEHADAHEIDGRGRYVLPGLVDSHAHVSSQGFLDVQLNLAGTPSVEDALEQIAAFAKANPGS
ncbi:MAG: amidohydrolase family protein, partial [Woeseiaceae bacterium]